MLSNVSIDHTVKKIQAALKIIVHSTISLLIDVTLKKIEYATN